MEHGCHSLSQLVQLFPGYDIEVGETDITWNGDLDSAVATTLYLSRSGHEVVVEYRVSRVQPVERPSRFVFENGVVTGDVTDAGGTIAISTDAEAGPENLTLEPSPEYATTLHQAMYLRWRQFLSRVRTGEREPNHVGTAPEVTETIDRIYERAQTREVR